jgi:hypothetical protein
VVQTQLPDIVDRASLLAQI